MTKVQMLQEEMEKLDRDEWAELHKWVIERDWEQWDREIEEDSESGALEEFMEEARKAHREGKSTKF
ncbi:MAG TPA: hypothetical protein VG323_07605 [Thermoanaerobaculia bacterium]|nr:hypothetical protein [Thermoanaerobaculia bacterium]